MNGSLRISLLEKKRNGFKGTLRSFVMFKIDSNGIYLHTYSSILSIYVNFYVFQEEVIKIPEVILSFFT